MCIPLPNRSKKPLFTCCFRFFHKTYNYEYHYHIVYNDREKQQQPPEQIEIEIKKPTPLSLEQEKQSMLFLDSNEDVPIELIESKYTGAVIHDLTPDHFTVEHLKQDHITANHYPYFYEPSRTTIPEAKEQEKAKKKKKKARIHL